MDVATPMVQRMIDTTTKNCNANYRYSGFSRFPPGPVVNKSYCPASYVYYVWTCLSLSLAALDISTGPLARRTFQTAGPVRASTFYLSLARTGHQISNSAGPNDDNSQYVFFARSPVPHLGSFRAALLLQRDASVSRVRVGHVNQTHWHQCLDHAALQREHPARIRALFSAKHMSWFRVNSFAFWSVNLKYWLINLRDRCKGL